MSALSTTPSEIDSPAAWRRLGISLALASIGGVGLWSIVVVFPTLQTAFGISRAEAMIAYTLQTLGFAGGGVLLGRMADRRGIIPPMAIAFSALTGGYVIAGLAPNFPIFCLAHAAIGYGCSVTLGPLVADTSQWFQRRRGIAVSICACGNYVSGVFWPPIVEHATATVGWRATLIGIGVICFCLLFPLMLALRRPAPAQPEAGRTGEAFSQRLGFSPVTLQVLLCIAGVACCVAMSMPQVHIVAYCGDLGYGAARGAQMLSLMLGFGIVSRILSGLVADTLGGVATLLLGSVLQGVALLLYTFFDSLTSLYVISALFGLFQGGIVPSYAIIIRDYFPPQETGTRVGLVIMCTLLGMALGGWMSGVIFDVLGSYRVAFVHGLGWNLLHLAIALALMLRLRERLAAV